MSKIQRRMGDALLKKAVALPFAANTVNTNYIDLGSSQPYPVTGEFEVKVTVDTATGANSKNVNTVLQHSDDTASGNFVNIPGLGAPFLVAAGNAANVIGANRSVQLPPLCKRYVRCQATGEANGGNSADGNLTVEALF